MLPPFLHRPLKRAYYALFTARYRMGQEHILRRIRRQQPPVRVVFFAANLSMWKYQRLYEALSAHPRFQVHLVLSPYTYYSREQQEQNLAELRAHFDALGISYIDYDPAASAPFDVRRALQPDILCYPQPYDHNLCPEHDSTRFYDRLLVYYPYAFWTATGDWSYNHPFHNVAWRLYYSTVLHRDEARRLCFAGDRNVRVVGYPDADDYLGRTDWADPWKPQSRPLKRIIWAPHFTITAEHGTNRHSNFLWMAGFMDRLAEKYADRIQVAFKPHPRLRTELYRHPDWGKERTDAYYRRWAESPNTQFVEGGYRDLFMTSDAMIHDSASFTVEYHYTQKPVFYVQGADSTYYDHLSAFGRAAIDAHYQGRTPEAIEDFLGSVVLGGADSMQPVRRRFYERYLLPPGGRTVLENTLADLYQALGIHE